MNGWRWPADRGGDAVRDRSKREEFYYLVNRILDEYVPPGWQQKPEVLEARRMIDEYIDARAATHDHVLRDGGGDGRKARRAEGRERKRRRGRRARPSKGER